MALIQDMRRGFWALAALCEKHAPTICLVTGLGGMTAAAVDACVQTAKSTVDLDEAAQEEAEIREKYKKGSKELRRALAKNKLKTMKKIGKRYIRPLVIGGLGAYTVVHGHKILVKRNMALAAACAMYEEELRERSKEEIEETRTQRKTVSEDGTEVTTDETTTVKKKAPDRPSIYAIEWKRGNPTWVPNPHLRALTLENIQKEMNKKLNLKFFRVLNDAYDELGVDRTQIGAIAGWGRTTRKYIYGDGAVIFSYYDVDTKEPIPSGHLLEYFEDHSEKDSIIIDFNVDGDIYSKIDDIIGYKNAIPTEVVNGKKMMRQEYFVPKHGKVKGRNTK